MGLHNRGRNRAATWPPWMESGGRKETEDKGVVVTMGAREDLRSPGVTEEMRVGIEAVQPGC